jgi:hypothetical protein
MTGTNILPSLPLWLDSFLATCPDAGGGLNDWLLCAANRLRHYVSKDEAFQILGPIAREHGRYDPREIERQVTTAYSDLSTAPTAHNDIVSLAYSQPDQLIRKSGWPEPNNHRIHSILASEPFGVCDLWEQSPVKLLDDEPHTDEIINILFPGDPLLCVGRSNASFGTYGKNYLLRYEVLSSYALIVPSTMSHLEGFTQAGRLSAHCIANTGNRRYLVVEFDSGSQDDQAAIIWHLRKYGPLVVVVYSGGKSLHAWFYCEGEDEFGNSRLRRFMEYAVSLGGDYHGWLKSQFMRMPDGWREDKQKRQTVF